MERVANFLLEMDRRLAVAGMMALPMCRRDIGDYLGLTLETVSRALSQLHDDGVLGIFRRPSDRAPQSAAPAEHGRLTAVQYFPFEPHNARDLYFDLKDCSQFEARHEPFDVQRRSDDPLEDRGHCARGGNWSRWLWNRGSYQNRRRIHPDSARHQSESAASRQKVCACSAER